MPLLKTNVISKCWYLFILVVQITVTAIELEPTRLTLAIYTADKITAGTNCNIYATIIWRFSQNKTKIKESFYELDQPGRNDFEPDSLDYFGFYIKSSDVHGYFPSKIKFQQDCDGRDGHAYSQYGAWEFTKLELGFKGRAYFAFNDGKKMEDQEVKQFNLLIATDQCQVKLQN